MTDLVQRHDELIRRTTMAHLPALTEWEGLLVTYVDAARVDPQTRAILIELLGIAFAELRESVIQKTT
jgi:hypothetical protein